ncbi:chain length determinant protein tyrosine kinase EpsG [Pseudoduganella sp. RAF53_2]|uniref:chain length determinant protein tyrosine kinase EpsG n=1 Tax=unclassified Pseudoduganella TaxID=2637179 RepID=UPI003F96C2B4
MNHPYPINSGLGHNARQASIGALLLESGKITPENAENVLALQREEGIRFGEAARRLGLVDEADIQQVLARQFDYPYVQVGENQYSPKLVAAFQPFSRQVEMLRAVRSQLMMRWFARGRKALAIVGAGPGDGASLFAANLAVVFSQLGENTLLVDANLRHPSQHTIFDLQGRLGLSDMLAGRASMDSVAPIDGFVSLSVLSAGTEPPNPAELLARHAFGGLNTQLEAMHDIVLYDCADLATASDALPVMARAHGVLVVVRKNKTSLYDVAALGEQAAQAGCEVVGSVLVDF